MHELLNYLFFCCSCDKAKHKERQFDFGCLAPAVSTLLKFHIFCVMITEMMTTITIMTIGEEVKIMIIIIMMMMIIMTTALTVTT